jgi:hypothetical protein
LHPSTKLQHPFLALLLVLPLSLAACGDDSATTDPGGAVADLDMTEADFDCLLTWPKVRLFRITNKLGDIDASVAVANAPGTADYPVGTVIQLAPNEASVKRRAGFSAVTNDWEFFLLETETGSTTIVSRGTTNVSNDLGTCLSCHSMAEPQFDFVCEKGQGCDALPLSDDVFLMAQQNDPRCTAAP